MSAKRILVKSSVIHSIAYDITRKTMEIEFVSGGIYRYYDVPAEVFDNFLHAPSHGQYFHQFIFDEYPYDRLL